MFDPECSKEINSQEAERAGVVIYTASHGLFIFYKLKCHF